MVLQNATTKIKSSANCDEMIIPQLTFLLQVRGQKKADTGAVPGKLKKLPPVNQVIYEVILFSSLLLSKDKAELYWMIRH